MNINSILLSLEVVYSEELYFQLEVFASNGRFAGTALMNSDPDDVIQFAQKLRGFPDGKDHVVEMEFGFTFEEQNRLRANHLKPDLSYVGLKFYCLRRSLQTVVAITIHEDHWVEREEARGKSSFELWFEPASLDRFVEEIILIGENRRGIATLMGIRDQKDFYY